MPQFMSRLRNGMAKMIAAQPKFERRQIDGTFPIMDLKAQFEEMVYDAAPGLSQPVWGPEISTVGHYSREGYTSKTFDKPIIDFKTQVEALARDEDVQLAINHLSSQITGGEHYWKGVNDQIVEHIEDFSTLIDFDELDTMMVKELLWFGNSFWKPRMGIAEIHSKDDLMHIPISSAVRIWWDRQRIPYKYEFRGAEYQGYHNPDEIIHLKWNPVNASAYGVGFGVAMTSPHSFMQITANGPEPNVLPSLLDRKYSNQLTMHVTERRYTPRNVYVAEGADEIERTALQAQLQDLKLGEDFVAGSSLKVQELGSMQRAFNPTQFTDTVLGPIMKAMNDFRGKQGTESSHQFANAKTSAVLDQIGLSSFPLTVTRMLIDQLFKPWYEANPVYDPSYGGGMIAIPWKICDYELNFGRVQKKDIELADQIKLIETGISSGALTDPIEIRKLLEDAGLGLREEYTEEMDAMYHPENAYPQDMDSTDYSFDNQTMGSPPMDNPEYDSMMIDVRGNSLVPEPYDAQPSDPRLNFTEKENIGNVNKMGEGGPGSGRKKGGGADAFDKTYGIGSYDKGPESPAVKKKDPKKQI
ncbi:hypothetical protein KAR91_03610 [Candidatus Pacearchaeota archaeon]|nr:hypothetical protein [Candidatus Pacearchaeota archaeon]